MLALSYQIRCVQITFEIEGEEWEEGEEGERQQEVLAWGDLSGLRSTDLVSGIARANGVEIRTATRGKAQGMGNIFVV